jgi:hypothetical protein
MEIENHPPARGEVRDKKAIACNVIAENAVFSAGSLAYLAGPPRKSRILICGRSRSGRWVSFYIPVSNLSSFRFKTIPPEHPRFRDKEINWGCSDSDLGFLESCKNLEIRR